MNDVVSVTPERPTKIAACEHIKFNGLQCLSPAMRNKHFCYHHSRIRYQRPTAALPLPDSFEAITYAAHGIDEALLAKEITPNEARALIYSLRLQLQALEKSKLTFSECLVTEDPNEERYRQRFNEIAPNDQTGLATRELLKDRVRFG